MAHSLVARFEPLVACFIAAQVSFQPLQLCHTLHLLLTCLFIFVSPILRWVAALVMTERTSVAEDTWDVMKMYV